MIKINLAKRKTASIPGNPEATGLSSLFTRGAAAGSEDAGAALGSLPLRSIAVALAGIYGSQFYFENERLSKIAAYETQIAKLKSAQKMIQAKLAKSSGFEELKKNLEADEKLVKTKLDVIVRLTEDKQSGVRALRLVSNSIPTEVWLQSLAITSTDFQASGQALDYSQVSDFMNRLGQAGALSDLNLDGSSQGKDEKGRSVASFKLTGKRK